MGLNKSRLRGFIALQPTVLDMLKGGAFAALVVITAHGKRVSACRRQRRVSGLLAIRRSQLIGDENLNGVESFKVLRHHVGVLDREGKSFLEKRDHSE
jgi:hypothetical protein